MLDFFEANDLSIDRRIGGLEIIMAVKSRRVRIDRRIGGLENQSKLGAK